MTEKHKIVYMDDRNVTLVLPPFSCLNLSIEEYFNSCTNQYFHVKLYNIYKMKGAKPLPSLPNQHQQNNQPLLSSNFECQLQNSKVDVVNLVSKQQQSRVTKVNLHFYQSVKKEKKEVKIPQRLLSLAKNSSEQQSPKYSKIALKREQLNQNRLTQHQSFLSSYQGNSCVGVLLYITFMALISAQILATTYFASNCSESQFCKTRGILLILSSELLYYLLVRFLNNNVKNRLFRESSLSFSFKSMLSSSKFCTFYKDQRNFIIKFIFQRPYILLSIIIATIIGSQIIYCLVATQSVSLFENGMNYLIPTIYWSNFVLPILMSNFYMNRGWDDKSFKVHLFPLLLFALMVECILQSSIFFVLSGLRLIYSYLHSKQGLQMFHIDQITKGVLLAIWLVIGCIQAFTSDIRINIKENVFLTIGLFCFQTIVITLSIMLSRIVGLVIIKQKLHRNFYTETHIHAAFIVVNILMYASYLNFQDQKYRSHVIHCCLAIFILILIGVLIYFQGKQKEELKIEANIID